MERLAWVLAFVLGGTWAGARGLAYVSKVSSLRAFENARLASPPEPLGAPSTRAASTSTAGLVDQSLWDRGRIRAYFLALARPALPPLAVLRIPRLHLEVPVLEGTGEWTLDRAVGHIQGTARPGESGNVGIAGHRDGFFRVLKDIVTDDLMELALATEVRRYRVRAVSIVRPEDVGVLAPDRQSLLTLVTCYPFYFVGSAPQRYIVRAALEP
jgi:sortase A